MCYEEGMLGALVSWHGYVPPAYVSARGVGAYYNTPLQVK